jgi:hypothetical protein
MKPRKKYYFFVAPKILNFRGKRAQSELAVATLIDFIILFVIIGLMVILAQKEMLSTKYDKMFLARDNAMFIDAIYASPYKLVVKYPQRTYDYSFKFEDSKVIVYKESEALGMSESFPFTQEDKVVFSDKTITAGSDDVDLGDDADNPIIYIKTEDEIEPISGIFVEDIE